VRDFRDMGRTHVKRVQGQGSDPQDRVGATTGELSLPQSVNPPKGNELNNPAWEVGTIPLNLLGDAGWFHKKFGAADQMRPSGFQAFSSGIKEGGFGEILAGSSGFMG